MKKILIADGDPGVANLLSGALGDLASIHRADDGVTAVAMASAEKYCLVTLELMLPRLAGSQICSALRSIKPAPAILAVTARPDLIAPLLGTRDGLADYVFKPFSIEDVRTKVVRLLEREHRHGTGGRGDDRAASSAVGERLPVLRCASVEQLSSVESDVLEFLSDRPGATCSREEVLAGVWGIYQALPARAIGWDWENLRRKLACACRAASPLVNDGDGRYGLMPHCERGDTWRVP